ncbi:MAG: JAB domain-containing protein [Candidatus Nanoarchaeia archaeon]|nr:JAB domain-containing protein [Candidatus Nanoarchaeia archaeon]
MDYEKLSKDQLVFMVKELDAKVNKKNKFMEPRDLAVILWNRVWELIEDPSKEHLIVVCLDASKVIIDMKVVSIGTFHFGLSAPREIFKYAILNNAVSIILIHNHPDGKCFPSEAEISKTENLKLAGDLIGIFVEDDMIITADTYFSFQKEGSMLYNDPPEPRGLSRYFRSEFIGDHIKSFATGILFTIAMFMTLSLFVRL